MLSGPPRAQLQEFGNWRDAIADGLSSNPAKELLRISIPDTAISTLTARLVLWQFEGHPYGLKYLPIVRGDEKLLHACENVMALCRQEIEGKEVSISQYEHLRSEIGQMWAIEGEKQRVRKMQFARRWAWIGARRWAWIGPKMWNNTWTWALTATRNRNYAQAVALTKLWSEVWIVLHQEIGKETRMRAFCAYFLYLTQKHES